MNLILDARVVVGVGAAVAGLALGFLAGWLARARREASLRSLLVLVEHAFDERAARLEEFLSAELGAALQTRRASSDSAKTTVYSPARTSLPPPPPPVVRKAEVRKPEPKTTVMPPFNPFVDEEKAARG